MDSNQKKFGLYVFLSTFSRNLIEVFIPVILYKFGYSLKEVVFYYLLTNIFSLILTYPIIYLSNKFNNKILSIIGIISFIFLQVLLNFMKQSPLYLLLLALFFALYRRGYWISRRYYNLEVIKKDKISTTYSLISILNQVAVIISAYIGGLVLDYISIKVLTIIAIILFALSVIPLLLLKFEHEKNSYKLSLSKTIKEVPTTDIYLFGSYELINVIKFLIPLYLFIYVKHNYQTIGVVSLITNISIIIFTFMFGKKLDKSNKNYLIFAIILTTLVYILKINTFGILLLIVSFFEGIIIKMYELSISKNFYTLSKKFEYYNYNLLYEFTQNLFRSIVVFLLFISNFNIKNMVYITLLFIFIGVFLQKRNTEVDKQ